MWRGTFEAEDSGDGRKSYHLRWQGEGKAADDVVPLTETEKRGGLFVRYLIAQGKLNELQEV